MGTIEKINESGSAAFYKVSYNGYEGEGCAVNLPHSDKYILSVRCKNGMLMCRLFNNELLDGFEIAGAVFGAPDLATLLSNKPVNLNKAALALGAAEGMTGWEIFELFSK